MKRTLSLLMAVLMLTAVVLTGCSSGDDTATLLAAVNDALKEMSEDGTLTALSEKYFGTDISKE